MQLVHQNSVYTCATPLQEAAAIGFEYELSRFNTSESFFKSLAVELKEKRNLMANFLVASGFEPTIPDAGYFMIANWSHLANKVDMESETDEHKDYRFTKFMTKNIGLQGMFYSIIIILNFIFNLTFQGFLLVHFILKKINI